MRALPSPPFLRISFGFLESPVMGELSELIFGQMMGQRQLPGLSCRIPCSCETVSYCLCHFPLRSLLSFLLSIIPFYTERNSPWKLPQASPLPHSYFSSWLQQTTVPNSRGGHDHSLPKDMAPADNPNHSNSCPH